MAFSFPTRDPQRVFFPTLHLHDGTLPQQAEFDHRLYVQGGRCPFGFTRSSEPIEDFVAVARTSGVVVRDAPVYRQQVEGFRDNLDVWARG